MAQTPSTKYHKANGYSGGVGRRSVRIEVEMRRQGVSGTLSQRGWSLAVSMHAENFPEPCGFQKLPGPRTEGVSSTRQRPHAHRCANGRAAWRDAVHVRGGRAFPGRFDDAPSISSGVPGFNVGAAASWGGGCDCGIESDRWPGRGCRSVCTSISTASPGNTLLSRVFRESY